jgi:hypothetical protein
MTAIAPATSTLHAPVFRWLFPTGLFTLIAIGALWAARPSDCVELYANGCQPVTTDSPAVVAGGVLIALYAAIVTVALTMLQTSRRTLILIILSAVLLLVALIGFGATVASTPSYPYPIPYEDF